MQIVVITPETTATDEAEQVNALFAAGLQRLHLRKPEWKEGDYEAYLGQIEHQYHYRIAIHNNFHLATRYGLGGVHLNSYFQQNSEVVSEVFKMAPAVTVSASFHSWAEVCSNKLPYAYIFISPVFDSISKQSYKAGIDSSELAKVKLEVPGAPQVYALGGVGVDNIGKLSAWGYDGAALLGSIWNSADPVKAFVEVMNVVRSLES